MQRNPVPLVSMRMWVQSLASLSVAMCCGVGHRCCWDPALLWLWHRLAAAADSTPSLGTPNAKGVALKRKKKRKEKKRREKKRKGKEKKCLKITISRKTSQIKKQDSQKCVI